ncbi:MAG: hypothetical protein E7677_05080 [Ruminococcaceae bacterium]|nr:hypothetical protein [Oscillospiraceae bacterium]
MLKGVNRNVIIVRGDRTSRFEAVYMIMKKGTGATETDILKEANRLVASSGMSSKRKRAPLWLSFSLGALAGATLASIVWLIVVL